MSKSVISYIKHIEDDLKKISSDPVLRNQYAWWLLEHTTGKEKAHLLTTHTPITQQQTTMVAQYLQDICAHHKPIAYILGTVPFGPLMLKVRPPILIPRPETEQWVFELLTHIKEKKITHLTILDLCTGSGCIALLCATLLPEATIYAVDISDDALQLAAENRQQLTVSNVIFIQSNLFELLDDVKFDLILSNPPYIGSHEQLDQSVTAWEDPQALYAPDNGYAIIERIITQAPRFLRYNKQLQQHHINQLYIEIGWQQKDTVIKMMQKEGYAAITNIKDQAGKDRVISGRVIHEGYKPTP